ncbi:type II secretion system protein [Vibrio bivalvicida]|uniref:Type II secretion system protein n=1 Tax=Vibrio bivalvicida TaxID=1276888 RepID=A0ABV4MKU4_9VIBR
MTRSKVSGFTLVELIVVILLVSIVSVYAASRYSGRSGFSPYAAQERVISVIRQVQVNRMQSNVDMDAITGNTNFTLSLLSNCIGSQAACVARDAGRSDWVSLNDVSFTSNVGALVNFDLLGNPDGVATPINIQMTSTDGTCAAVQINAVGYVSAGGC